MRDGWISLKEGKQEGGKETVEHGVKVTAHMGEGEHKRWPANATEDLSEMEGSSPKGSALC